MARPKKATKPSAENKQVTSGLSDALAFIKQAQKPIGNAYETHCMMANGGLWAYDGTLAMGHPIPESLVACPQTGLFVDALKRVGAGLSLTQVDVGQLLINSDNFRAIVPCLTFQDLPNVFPDNAIAPCTDELKIALAKIVDVPMENSPQLIMASIKLSNYSAMATDGKLITEVWHGVSMPDLVIPKSSAVAITKQSKKLVSFGFSPSTLTLWYENGSWLRTNLYEAAWPDMSSAWREFKPENMKPLAKTFFEAIEAVAPFNSGSIYVGSSRVSSHKDERLGASMMVPDVEDDIMLNARRVLMLRGHVDAADLADDVCYFLGTGFRAALAPYVSDAV